MILTIEVANVGTVATTILEVYAYAKPGAEIVRAEGPITHVPFGQAHYLASANERFELPYRLEPNGAWRGRVKPDSIEYASQVDALLITVVDVRGLKVRHETATPRRFRKVSNGA